MSATRRIESLDYLRGAMALAVMLYHYSIGSGYELGSETVLGRLGIYAVGIFYVLSGLSLSLVYFGRIGTGVDIADFVVRRVFRIFPLFWIVITLSLLFTWTAGALKGVPFAFPWSTIALNYSLLFGFVAPSAYLSTGAWSIGNEMVFYAIFPFVVLLSRRATFVLPTVLLVSWGVEACFAYRLLAPGQPIATQWNTYINPFNQTFLFFSGAAMGAYLRPGSGARLRSGYVLLAVLCIGMFCMLPSQADHITLVTGWRRLALSACCIVFVGCVLLTNFSITGLAGRCLAFLGEGCYSIYLLHPLVAIPVLFIFQRYRLGPVVYAYTLAAGVTLLASWITFRHIERPLIATGRRLSERFRAAPVLSAS